MGQIGGDQAGRAGRRLDEEDVRHASFEHVPVSPRKRTSSHLASSASATAAAMSSKDPVALGRRCTASLVVRVSGTNRTANSCVRGGDAPSGAGKQQNASYNSFRVMRIAVEALYAIART